MIEREDGRKGKKEEEERRKWKGPISETKGDKGSGRRKGKRCKSGEEGKVRKKKKRLIGRKDGEKRTIIKEKERKSEV